MRLFRWVWETLLADYATWMVVFSLLTLMWGQIKLYHWEERIYLKQQQIQEEIVSIHKFLEDGVCE